MMTLRQPVTLPDRFGERPSMSFFMYNCNGLWGEESQLEHEMFIKTGPHYYYDKTGYMVVQTRPFVRCKPAIPMEYAYKNWDFGWAIVCSDGHVAGLYYDPYTLKPQKTFSRHAMRWFVRKH